MAFEELTRGRLIRSFLKEKIPFFKEKISFFEEKISFFKEKISFFKEKISFWHGGIDWNCGKKWQMNWVERHKKWFGIGVCDLFRSQIEGTRGGNRQVVLDGIACLTVHVDGFLRVRRQEAVKHLLGHLFHLWTATQSLACPLQHLKRIPREKKQPRTGGAAKKARSAPSVKLVPL